MAVGTGARILVVEDDPALNEIMTTFLTKSGYACTAAYSGTEACLLLGIGGGGEGVVAQAGGIPFDLIVLDLMLPGMAGEELLARLRGTGADEGADVGLAGVPVVVVSAKGAVASRVDVLRAGADDYLCKPFQLEELLVRIEVQLRHAASRAGGAEGSDAPAGSGDRTGRDSSAMHDALANAGERAVVSVGAWVVSAEARTLVADGRAVALTRTEFDIVWLLATHPQRVFTKHELLGYLHDGDVREEKTASTHIGNIRAKLKGTGTEDYIQTVWGVGFKLRDGLR